MEIERLKDHCTEATIPNKWTITRLEEQGGHRSYVLTEISKNGEDAYSEFVVKTIEKLNYQYEHLGDYISRFKSHGRLRSKAEMKRIKIQREQQKRQIPHILNVFCGREKLPIKFIKSFKAGNEEIVGFEIQLPNGSEANLSNTPQTSV
jgi:hypothetical protein